MTLEHPHLISILVCGGRDYADEAKIAVVLDRIHRDNDSIRLVHGGCGDDADIPTGIFKGADGLAHAWALARGVPIRVYPARWSVLGKGAGPERNARLLRMEPVALTVAFAGARGTADMVNRNRLLGIPLICVR